MMRVRLVSYVLLSLVFMYATPLFAQSASSATTGPGAISEVTQTIDEIIKIDALYVGDEKKTERRAKLREVIQPRFDFAEMAKRSLGAAWLEITPEQQVEFVAIFSDLLAATYLSRIESIKEGMVRIDGEVLDGSRSLVKTIVESKGDKFPIDYKLILNAKNQWRVFDVVIENIGLVSNYRAEFSGIIRREKFEGLMVKLREKSVK